MTTPEVSVGDPLIELAALNETDSSEEFIDRLFDKFVDQAAETADTISGYADFSRNGADAAPKLVAYTRYWDPPNERAVIDCEVIVIWDVTPQKKITNGGAVILIRDIPDPENPGPTRAFYTDQMQSGIFPLNSKYSEDHSEPHDEIFRSIGEVTSGELESRRINFSQARREIGDLVSPKIDFIPY